jgi:hypothetical protein
MSNYQRVKEFMRKRTHKLGAEDIYAAMEEYAQQCLKEHTHITDNSLDGVRVEVLKLIRQWIEDKPEHFDHYIAEREAWKIRKQYCDGNRDAKSWKL